MWLSDPLPFAAPPAPLLIDRGDRHLMVRRVPVPDGEVLLVSEVHNDHTAALLHRLGLTRREAETLLLLTDGHTIAVAASRLGISPRTVEKHIQRGDHKLGLDNRVGRHESGSSIWSGVGVRSHWRSAGDSHPCPGTSTASQIETSRS